MELLNSCIDNNLKKELNEISNILFNSNNLLNRNKIGYFNIYHNLWNEEKNNKYIDFINKIINQINISDKFENIKLNSILYAGFIYSFPNCNNQNFHYDYSNKSKTYFLPLKDLTDLNVTEFFECGKVNSNSFTRFANNSSLSGLFSNEDKSIV